MAIGNFVVIWHFSPHFGTLCQEKSGNPGYDYKVTLKSRQIEKKIPASASA
jgi:hypothetical protein